MTEYIFDIDELILFILKKMEEISASIFLNLEKKVTKKAMKKITIKKAMRKTQNHFKCFVSF